MKYLLFFVLFIINMAVGGQDKSPLAEKPPLGWNSFDSYGFYLHEEAAMANLEAIAEILKPFGYEYFVIDAGWFGEFKLQEGTIYSKEKYAEKLNFNEYGLLRPSKCYFPNGLQLILNRCHELGLKFGLHLMRGIPRGAVRQNTLIKGTKYFAQDIVDTTSICAWNQQNYGVYRDISGAQKFYNSLIGKRLGREVDFIKYDNTVPFPKEAEGVVLATLFVKYLLIETMNCYKAEQSMYQTEILVSDPEDHALNHILK